MRSVLRALPHLCAFALVPLMGLVVSGCGYLIPAGVGAALGTKDDSSNTPAVLGAPTAASGLSSVQLSSATVVADGGQSSTVTVRILDGNGQPLAGQFIALSVLGNSGATITQPAQPTNLAGETSGTIASTEAGTALVSATVNPGPTQVVVTNQPTITFMAGPPSAGLSTFTASPTTRVADGVSTSVLQVVINDAQGNPVPGATVSFGASGTGAVVTQPAGPTDATGAAAGSVVSTVAEAKTITATINPGPSQVVLATAPVVTFGAGPVDAGSSTVSPSPTSGLVADGVASSAITITLVDAFGNPVSGETVTLAATGSGNAITQPVAVTDVNGQTTGSLASTAVEIKTVTATVASGPLVLTQTPTVEFVATGGGGGPSAGNSSVTAAPTSLTADGVTTTTITITVRDATNAPMPGQGVVVQASGSGNTIVQPVGPTNASGQATATVASTVAEAKTISATVNPGPSQVVISQQPTVTFNPGPVSPGVSSVVSSPNSVTADGSATTTVTVTVRDAQGNPIPGQSVTLAATGGGNTITQPAGVTDANGQATGTVASTVAEGKTVSATAGATGLSDTPAVTFVPGPVSAGSSLVVAAPLSLTADGAATSTVTLTVRDAQNNPISGQSVVLSATGSGNTITQPVGVTDATGQITGSIASTLAEAKTLTATVNPGASQVVLNQQPVVTFDPGGIDAAGSTVAASPAVGVVADGAATSTITVTVLDAQGNPISGETVTLATTGSGNTLTQPVAVTDASGQTTGSIASTVAETKTITATASTGPTVLLQTPTVDFVAGGISPSVSTVVAAPLSLTADGVATSTITVTVLDAQGNPLAGQVVNLFSTGTGNSIIQPALPTDPAGQATATIASTVAETKSLTAIVNPGPTQVVLTTQPSVDFTPGAIAPGVSTVVASPAAGVTADGLALSTITVTLLDAQGNPIAGEAVTLAATGTGNTLTQPAGVTDAAGQITGTIASSVAEVKTITATATTGPTVLTTTPTVTFVPGAVSPGTSTVVAAPLSLTANGAATSTVTVTVVDAQGNPLAGQIVSLSATGTGNTITQPAGPTDALGQATGSIASTVAEAKTLTATVNPGASQVVLVSQPVVTFDPGPIDNAVSTVVANPVSGIVNDGAATSTITITVRDALGNPIPGEMVTLTATGGGNTITQPGAVTDANGQTTGTIASTLAETKTIQATVATGPTVLLQAPSVTFVSGSASVSAGLSSVVAAPAGPLTADGAANYTVTITVRDDTNAPMSGQIVSLAASGSGNSITQPVGTTNAAGQITGSITSTVAELKTITATVNPGASQVVLNDQPGVTFAPGAIDPGVSTVVAAPAAGVVANGVATSTITVTVLDAQGNPIPGETVTLAATGAGNTVTQPAFVTDANGQATGSVASTVAGTKSITATSSTGPVVLVQTPTVDFVPGPISPPVSAVVASPASLTADGAATSTITITVSDAQGNPLPGLSVSLAATGSGNSLTQPAGVTGAAGQITGSIASTAAGPKTITATVDPGGADVIITQQPVVTFNPGAIDGAVSTVVANPTGGLLADGVATSTITVTLTDAQGNPIAGETVTLSATGSGNSLTQPAGPTDASGQVTGTIATTVAETKTITATAATGPVVLVATPTVTFQSAGANVSAGLSSVTAAPAGPLTADGVAVYTVTITVRDDTNAVMPGQAVTLAASGSGNAITQPVGVTDAAGQITGTIASTVAEAKTLTATVNPGASQVVLTQEPVVTFAPGAIDAGTSTVVATPSAGVTADGAATSTITITLRDANGNPIPGEAVTLAASGSGNTLTQPAGTTDAAGEITGTIASTVAESKTVTATATTGPVVLTQTPSVAFVPGPVSAGVSTVVAVPTSLTADGVATSTITITVTDAQGNPIAGESVSLAASGSGNTLTQPVGTTDAAGQITGSIASTVAEAKTITATVDPGGADVILTQQPSVTFDPGAIDDAVSTVVVSPSSVTADGAATATVTVTVRDALGNPIPGVTVILAATGTGNTLTQPGAVTDAAGQATGSLASTDAETKTVSATANAVPLVAAPTVDFVPGAISAGTSTVVAAPAAGLTADGAVMTTITVTVLDAQGNPIAGQSVFLAASGTGNTLTQPVSTTDAAGQATGTLASTRAEAKTVTATVNPGPSQVVLNQQPTATFVPGAVSAAVSTVAAAPAAGVISDGVEASTITITVLDANGNPIAGEAVTLAASGTGNTLTQPVGVTDAAGQITGSIASTVAETKTITATVTSGPTVLTQTPTVGFVAGAVSAGDSTVAVVPAAVVADGVATSTITVTVLDAQGNPVAGQQVFLAASGSGNTITQPVGLTDLAGQATGSIASTVAEAKTVVATVNPGASQVVLTQQPLVTFTPGAVDAGVSTVVAAPTSVTADGVETSTITITVRDAQGNPIAGEAVTLAATGTGNTLTQPVGTTDAAGQITGSIVSTVAESKTITATVTSGPTVLTQTPSVSFVPGAISPSVSTVVVAPPSLTANGVATSTVTITVTDAQGNPRSGLAVSLVATGTGNSITQPVGLTDAAGQIAGSIASTTAEAKTVTATVDPGGADVILTQQPTVTFTPGPISATVSTVVANPTSGLIADGVATSTITITVRDAQGNPIPGEMVTLSSSGTGNTLTQPGGLTDANGVTTGSIASTVAEAKMITATVATGPVVLVQVPTVTFVSGGNSVSAGLSSVSATPAGPLTADGVQAYTVTVTVRDTGNAPMSGQVVSLSATGAGNVITQPAGPTDGAGVATATIAATAAETKTLTVTVNPGASQVVLNDQPLVSFVPGAVDDAQCTVVAAPTSLVADGAATSTITITLRDANGNPVPGEAVTLAATGTGNTIVQPAGVTDAAGQVTGSIASVDAQTKVVTATVTSGPLALSQTPSVDFVPGQPSAGTSTVLAAPAVGVVADGVATSTITVTVLDAQSNPIVGQTVTLAATGTGNTIVQPAGVTDAAGQVTGTVASTVAEAKTVSATVDPGGLAVIVTQQPSVQFVAGPIDPAVSTVSALPTSGLIADNVSTSTITVTLRDALGNPVVGETVVLSSTGSGNTFVQPPVTNASGVATGTLATSVAETKTISATAATGPTLLNDTPSVTFIPPTVSAGQSAVSAAPLTVEADGATVSVVTITVRDTSGTPLPGQTVTIAASGSGNVITQPAGVTDALGQTTATIASTNVETKTITTTVNPGANQVVLVDQPMVDFVPTPPDPDNSSVVAAPLAVRADGTSTTTVTVTVRDASNNPIPGATVVLSATGSGNTIVQPGPTDASGVTTGTVASTVIESKTITATANAVGLTDAPVVSFDPFPEVSASTLPPNGGPPFTLSPGDSERYVLRLNLTETQGNVGATVTSLTIRGSGSGNELTDLGQLELHRDSNGNGSPNGQPLASAIFDADDGTATFTGFSRNINAGGLLRLIVSYDVAGTASPGTTFVANVQVGGVGMVSQADASVVQASGLPVNGPTFNVVGAGSDPQVDVTQAVAIPPGSVNEDDVDVEVLQLRLTETTGNGLANFTTLTVTAGGGGTDDDDILFVRLWRDAGTLGVRDGADTLIGLTTFFVDDGLATFGSLTETIPSSGSQDYLLTYDMADVTRVMDGETYNLTVAVGDVILEKAGGGAVGAFNLPQTGPTLTVPTLDPLPLGPGPGPGPVALGGPVFAAPQAVDLQQSGVGVIELASGDLNGDGHTDVVVLTSTGRIEVLLSDGAGGLVPGPLGGVFPMHAVADPRGLVLGDVTGDGHLDAVAFYRTGFRVFAGVGAGPLAGSFPASSSTTEPGADLTSLGLVDVDGDGDLDVVAGDGGVTPRLVGWTNDGSGTLNGPSRSLPLAVAPRQLAAADLDGDGRGDLVFTDAGAPAHVNVARGDGAFFTLADQDVMGGLGGFFTVVDMDGDGDVDVLAARDGGGTSLSVFANGGGQLQVSGPDLLLGAGVAGHLTVGDWDADGDVDAVVCDPAGNALHVVVGDGTLTPSETRSVDGGPGADRVVSVDLDGDGDLDLLTGSSTRSDGRIHVVRVGDLP